MGDIFSANLHIIQTGMIYGSVQLLLGL